MNVIGLKNAPGQFQRMMDDVLSPVSDTTTPYIDDVLVGTQAVEGEDLYESHNRDVGEPWIVWWIISLWQICVSVCFLSQGGVLWLPLAKGCLPVILQIFIPQLLHFENNT